jgi:hypothetical protein
VKRLLTALAVGAIAVIGWITFQDFRTFDPRTAVTRASVVAYGHVITSPRSHIVIDEIWKSESSSGIAAGTIVPFSITDNSADRALVCFTPRLFSRQLSVSNVFFVRGDRVGSPAVPLSDLKALCVATPRT